MQKISLPIPASDLPAIIGMHHDCKFVTDTEDGYLTITCHPDCKYWSEKDDQIP